MSDATPTIQLQGEKITVQLSKHELQQFIWESVPEFLTDPHSPARKQNENLYLIAKPVLRQVMQSFLKHVFQEQSPKIPRDADIFAYTTNALIQLVTEYAASRVWEVDIREQGKENGRTVYRVCFDPPVRSEENEQGTAVTTEPDSPEYQTGDISAFVRAFPTGEDNGETRG